MTSDKPTPTPETTLLSVRSFPAHLHQKLRVLAVERSLTMGELLAIIVEEWLTNNDSKKV
ncbi:hypothetical protein [Nostoc sp.]|uniref:hypothetical protein n=1 Tax=Nostoc sp. TaxID=1180 RepID=UPI002FF9A347